MEILLSKPISEELQDLEKWTRYGGLNDTEQHSCSKKIKTLIEPVATMEKELKIAEAREEDAYANAEICFISTIKELKTEIKHYRNLCDVAAQQIDIGTKSIIALQNEVERLRTLVKG